MNEPTATPAAGQLECNGVPVADTFAERPYPGGLTYSGHPLACASAVASIEIFKEEGLVERSAADDYRLLAVVRGHCLASAAAAAGALPVDVEAHAAVLVI